jgi:ribose 5-phosphate isomerase B
MDRRTFMHTAFASALLAGSISKLSIASNAKTHKESSMMNLVIAADPFAVDLKDAVKKHLIEQGYKVIDVGSTGEKEVAYYDAASAACKLIHEGKAKRGILFCGTGMGMSIVANKFEGITASCVESVFAAKMARSINDSNVLTMGSMIVAEWMGKEMVDVWMKTKHTEGLEQFGDFLKDAVKKVDGIDHANRK